MLSCYVVQGTMNKDCENKTAVNCANSALKAVLDLEHHNRHHSHHSRRHSLYQSHRSLCSCRSLNMKSANSPFSCNGL